ncbi:MAG: putative membrane protein [Bacteroidia bacterium]|jgi:uncharacterized membrane protein
MNIVNNMDNIQILIYAHAGLGGLALLAGATALFAKKGSWLHKKSGKSFYWTMLATALLALSISILPKHESPFLFAIGIFSTYFIISGYRALQYKHQKSNLIADKIIAWVMIVTGISMILYPVIQKNSTNVVLTVFGSIGLIFAIRDLTSFKNLDQLKSDYLKLHAGKMIGAYISAVTAFVVVNELIPSIYGWFIPGIIGGVYIAYWMRKLNKKSGKKKHRRYKH